MKGWKRIGIFALAIMAAAVPVSAQPPAACPVPGWTGPGVSVPPDAPPDSNWMDEGSYGAKGLTTRFIDPRTFEARFTAKGADNSGLGALYCLAMGTCGLDTLLEWLGSVLDWASFSKGEITRQLDLTLNAPPGTTAAVRVDVLLEGLQGVYVLGLAHGFAKVTADASVKGPGEATPETMLAFVQTDELWLAGASTRHLRELSNRSRSLTSGQVLSLRGHLRAEARSEFVVLGLGYAASQFRDSMVDGLYASTNPPIYIPEPGLKIRATIVNVSPVLAPVQDTVSFTVGEVASTTGTLCDSDSTDIQLSASFGTVTNNQNGTWSWSHPTGGGLPARTVTITADDREGGVAHATFALQPQWPVDVRPKTVHNIIDLRVDGKVPVALLATQGFDPHGIDPAALRFGRTGTEASLVRLTDTGKPACSGADVNEDGLWDLVCSFQVSRMGFQCGDSLGVLGGTAPLFGAGPVVGRDHVVLLPCSTIRPLTVLHEGLPLWAGYSGVAASPDGARLYVASDERFFWMPAGGGPLTQIGVDHLGQAAGLAVSPDGRTLYAVLLTGPLAAWNPVVAALSVADGGITMVADLPAHGLPGGLAVSPDGTTLFIASANPPDTVLSVPATGGTPANILSAGPGGSVRDVAITRSGTTLFLGADMIDRLLSVPAAGGLPAIIDSGVAFRDPVNVAISPDKSMLFVLDPNIRVDAAGVIVETGGQAGAVFMGPAWGGPFALLAVGGEDFTLTGRIAVSPDGSRLFLGGLRRATGAPVILSVPVK
jgi:hypothetical protein